MKKRTSVLQCSGNLALIDAEDLPRVSSYNWKLNIRTGDKSTRNYVMGVVSGNKVYLHRLIMSAKPGEIVDHINRDTLDNRKCNLRLVNSKTNRINSKINNNNSTGHRNVSFVKSEKKYKVSITTNGKVKYIGQYPELKQASLVANMCRRMYYGPDCEINGVIDEK